MHVLIPKARSFQSDSNSVFVATDELKRELLKTEVRAQTQERINDIITTTTQRYYCFSVDLVVNCPLPSHMHAFLIVLIIVISTKLLKSFSCLRPPYRSELFLQKILLYLYRRAYYQMSSRALEFLIYVFRTKPEIIFLFLILQKVRTEPKITSPNRNQ